MRAGAWRAALGVLGEDLKAGSLRSLPSSALRAPSPVNGRRATSPPRRTTRKPAFSCAAKTSPSPAQREKGWLRSCLAAPSGSVLLLRSGRRRSEKRRGGKEGVRAGGV